MLAGSCLVPELSWTVIIGRLRCRLPCCMQKVLHLPRQSAPDQISIACWHAQSCQLRGLEASIACRSTLETPAADRLTALTLSQSAIRFVVDLCSTLICTATELSSCILCRAEMSGASLVPGRHDNPLGSPSNRRSFGPSFSAKRDHDTGCVLMFEGRVFLHLSVAERGSLRFTSAFFLQRWLLIAI